MTNIAKILKNASKGLKLYSLIHGKVTLKSVDNAQDYPIEIIDNKNNSLQCITKDGKFYYEYTDSTY